MTATLAIAVNTFRESVRDKVLYNLVLFAILLIGGSYLIGQLTAGQDVKIIKDLGLAATSMFGLFIAVFIGIGLVSKEVERRSVYALLAKPIHRYQLVLGKYCGLILTLAVNVSVMALALYLVLTYMSWGMEEMTRASDVRPLDPALLTAMGLILVELMLVTAIALLFSTFSTPILSAALTFGLYAIPNMWIREPRTGFDTLFNASTTRSTTKRGILALTSPASSMKRLSNPFCRAFQLR